VMKRKTGLTAICFLLSGAGVVPCVSEDSAAQCAAAVQVSALSAYVWRGQVLNDEPVMQTSLALEKSGLGASAWANFNLTANHAGDALEASEVDLSLFRKDQVRGMTVKWGLVEYSFPNQTVSNSEGSVEATPSTREFFAELGYKIGRIAPGIGAYYDFGEADSCYVSMRCSADIAGGLSVSCSAGYGLSGYNSFYFGVDKAGWNDFSSGASLALPAGQSATLTLMVQYSGIIDPELRDTAGAVYRDDAEWFGGAAWDLVF